MRYEDASHTGAFQGSEPEARDDADAIPAGSHVPATGNVITGEGTQTGPSGSDAAAGAHITSIAGAGGEDSSFAGGKLAVSGEFGRLSIDAEGNYSYQAKEGTPENSRDRFTYTLADSQGGADTATLTIEIGKTPAVIKAGAQQVVPGPDGVVVLPAGVELSDIHIVGRNLVIDLPDGGQMVIIDGAVFVPQLVLGGVEVPATNLAALLIGQEIAPGEGGPPQSSGGNFDVPVPPLDPGIPLGDLIPPTEYGYQPPEVKEVFDLLDEEPEAGSTTALLDDDAQEDGNPLSNTGDDPGGSSATGFLPGSGGDGDLTWNLLAAGDLPAGFTFAEQPNGDVWILQGGIHVITISIDPTTGEYEVDQLQAIDHPAGGNENNLIFTINYTVTDEDGDSATGSLVVDVDDDMPTVSVQAGPDSEVVLTTDDADTIGANSDSDSTTADFSGVFSGSSVVFGADGAGPGSSSTYALAVTGSNSGLTSHGSAINLFVVGGVVYGTTAGSAGAIDAGNTIFTVSTTNSGEVTLTQFQQIDHTNADPSPTGDPYPDHIINMADGLVTLTRSETAVDGDGDQVTGSATVNIGANLNFTDDGPTIDPSLNEVGAAVVDESAPVDAATIAIVDGYTRGDDPDLSGGLAIGKGSTSGPVIDANASFGADGPANGGGISYDLDVLNTVSGLTTTEGTAINLVELTNGVVVGVVDGTTTVAFAISIDSGTGVVSVEQYLSIFHSDSPDNYDEPAFLDEGSLGVTVTASDFDGDSVTSDAVDITSLIRFEDDGPTAAVDENATLDTLVLDETTPPGTETDGDSNPAGLVSTTANFADNFVSPAGYGADGAGSVGYSLVLDGENVASGLYAVDPSDTSIIDGDGYGRGAQIVLNQSGNTITGSVGAVDYFTISIDPATGVVTFTQLDNIWHANTGSDDDTSTLTAAIGSVLVQQTVTDGDGDIATADVDVSQGVFQIEDDGPVAKDDIDTVPSGEETATGNVITGSSTAGGTGNADDVGADTPGRISSISGFDGTDTSFSGGFLVIDGEFGTLQIDANGNYTYTRFEGAPGSVQDVFTYTLIDADGDTDIGTLTININDSAPTLPDPALIHLDDDVIPGKNGNDPDGPGDDNPDGIGNNVVDGQLNGSGGDGALTYNFTGDDTLPTGFTIGAASDDDTLLIVQDQNGSPVTVMTIQLDQSDGSFTVTQNNPILHPTQNGDVINDNTENNLDFSIGVEVEDGDHDVEPAHITINVDDDTPTINVTKGADAAVILTTDDADTIGASTDSQQSTANFGGVFGLTQSAGADGTNTAATLSYALDVTGYAGGPAGVDSGLDAHGSNIYLYEIGGKVVGSTSATLAGVLAGNTVFDVSVNGTGQVTLTQYSQIDHPIGSDPSATGGPLYADHIVSLADSLVTLTASASLTDKDGDTVTDSEVVGIGSNLQFTDDGPDAATSGQAVGTVTLDETRAEGTDTTGGTAPNGDASATINFSGNFVNGGSVDYGADGPGSTVYSLQLTGTNVNSGLYALDNTDMVVDGDGYGQGGQIVLNQSGNTITGSFNGTNYFTLTIDPTSGVVTFTQLNNIWHPTAGSSAAALDESATLNTLAANLVQVVQTVTDFDGDTDTASINVGQGVFIIQDDGPRFGTVDTTLQVDNDDTPSATGDFQFTIGTDSPNGGSGNQNPDDILVSNFAVSVNGESLDASDVTFTAGAEDSHTANYTFSFDYDTGNGGIATAEGTLVFDKDAGTYTVELTNGPLQAFSTFQTAQGSAFTGYEFDSTTPDNTQPAVAVTTIKAETSPGAGDGFYVQYTGFTAGNGSHETINPPFPDATADGSFANGDLFSEGTSLHQSWVSVSNDSNGVGGDTINGPDAINFNLYSSDPKGDFNTQTGNLPTASASDMFLTFDGVAAGDDFIVVLKLWADTDGIEGITAGDTFTTKAIVVEAGDMYLFSGSGAGSEEGNTVAALAGTPYEDVVADIVASGGSNNNDGLVIIESNDYNGVGENWQIVGAQVVNASAGVTGSGINLDPDVGATGGSGDDGTVNFNTVTDTAPMKITNIGFIAGDSTDQNATLEFDVTIHDADGDTATTSVTVNIGDTSGNALLAAATTMAVSSEPANDDTSSFSLFAADSQDQQLQKTAANSNTTLLAAAVAASGLAGTQAAASPGNSDFGHQMAADSPSLASKFASLAVDSGEESRVALSNETRVAANDEVQTLSSSHGSESARSAHGLDNAAAHMPAELSDFFATADQGPAVDAAAAGPVAPAIAMVSAEALQAAGLDGTAKHGGEVDKVVADALGHAAPPTVDSLLQALGGHGGGELSAISHVASPAADAVPAWDMGSAGAFVPGADMMFKMGAEMLHHDAVQPVVNG